MKLYLVKPDLTYYEQYNEMMTEWYESKTHIAPWFLGEPMQNPEEFEALIRMLDNCEHGIVDEQLENCVYAENDEEAICRYWFDLL